MEQKQQKQQKKINKNNNAKQRYNKQYSTFVQAMNSALE